MQSQTSSRVHSTSSSSVSNLGGGNCGLIDRDHGSVGVPNKTSEGWKTGNRIRVASIIAETERESVVHRATGCCVSGLGSLHLSGIHRHDRAVVVGH